MSLPLPSLHPSTPNFVLSDPAAPFASTFQPSGVFPPSLENSRLTQITDAFPACCSHVPTLTSLQKATLESERLRLEKSH